MRKIVQVHPGLNVHVTDGRDVLEVRKVQLAHALAIADGRRLLAEPYTDNEGRLRFAVVTLQLPPARQQGQRREPWADDPGAWKR